MIKTDKQLPIQPTQAKWFYIETTKGASFTIREEKKFGKNQNGPTRGDAILSV